MSTKITVTRRGAVFYNSSLDSLCFSRDSFHMKTFVLMASVRNKGGKPNLCHCYNMNKALSISKVTSPLEKKNSAVKFDDRREERTQGTIVPSRNTTEY